MIPVQIDRCPMHVLKSLIDVSVSGIAPAARCAVIFFMPQIGAGASQQFHNLAKTILAREVGVHARMVLEIFAVKHRGTINFANCGFDLAIGNPPFSDRVVRTDPATRALGSSRTRKRNWAARRSLRARR